MNYFKKRADLKNTNQKLQTEIKGIKNTLNI